MAIKTASDLMVPLEEISKLPSGASLAEAVGLMEAVQCSMGLRCSRRHVVLVTGDTDAVVGWLGMRDVLTSLDPRYHTRKGLEQIRAPGIHPDEIRTLVESFGASLSPLEGICEKAARVRVDDLMHRPGGDDTIEADASLDEVVIPLVNGGHRLLIVQRDGRTVGVLSLEDVFEAVSEAIQRCEV